MLSKIKHVAIVVGLATVLATGGALGANAVVEGAGGGTWDHGVDYGYMTVWSNYFHLNRTHGSTSCNAYSCDRSDLVPYETWSYSNIGATYGGNKVYYRFG